MILQLRPIAGIVALASALPLITTGGISGSLRSVALGLFVGSFVAGTALFYRLRTSANVGRVTYLFSGFCLGVLPAAILHLISFILAEPAPPVAMVVVGGVTGLLAGLALRNLSPFHRGHG
jgi:hypothetical protein